ncbi:MAG: V-type ATP synthase subunit D [Clostridia bacterium]|nr:V-type ATP synthase subunit D [Clostridia bacterium]
MAVLNVNLTRIESINMKKSLKTAQKGHKLLKDKLDELIKKLLNLVRENQELRRKSDEMLKYAYQSFMLAKAVIGEEYIEEALIIPRKSVSIDISEVNIMSVKIPKFNFSNNLADIDKNEICNNALYGLAYTTSELDLAINSFSEVSESLLKLAQNEKAIELISSEIKKTRRRVNAIENVTIPNYIDTIKYIQLKLSEDERASTSRLMKIKEMIVEE